MEKDSFIEIEQYLRGELSMDEVRAFIDKVQDNPDLKASLFNHILADRAIDNLLRKKTEKELQAIRDKHGRPTLTKPRLNRMVQLLIAAGFAVLAALAIWLFTNNSSTVNLIHQQYEIASAPTKLRSVNGDDSKDENMELGRYLFFVKEDYKAAISVFEKISRENKKSVDAQYYLGHCFLKSNRFEKAILQFQGVLNQKASLPDYIDPQELQWNLMLSYWGNDQKKEAKNILDQLSEDPDLKEPIKSKLQSISLEDN